MIVWTGFDTRQSCRRVKTDATPSLHQELYHTLQNQIQYLKLYATIKWHGHKKNHNPTSGTTTAVALGVSNYHQFGRVLLRK